MVQSASNRELPASAGGSSELPLFYKRPVVLRFEEHKTKALAPQRHYRFAASSNAVPISVSEFMPAIRSYPIVFAEGTLTPVVIVGLKQSENLFLEPDGTWRDQTYVPGYLRRYPFILTQVPRTNTRALTIDASSERFVDIDEAGSEWRLFAENGDATPMADQILTFCEHYHQQHLVSEAFVAALQEADLLVAKNADMSFSDKSTYQLGGFRVVDAERFRGLPLDTIEQWHAKGWLNAIALHMASQQNWQQLLVRHQVKARIPNEPID